MTSEKAANFTIADLNAMDDRTLSQVDWKSLTCFNGRLLDMHAEGQLGNEKLAKLPRRPILCIDQIERIDDDAIEASFSFPAQASAWAFNTDESLEMLFQDQLDQLVGFWGCRKVDGIGRALSSGSCKLSGPLRFTPGKRLRYVMSKRKWMENKVSGSGGTAVFNGKILDDDDTVVLETKNVIVGILAPQDIQALRDQYGGSLGVDNPRQGDDVNLQVPLYDSEITLAGVTADRIESVHATQEITPQLWPLRFHFRGDPVVPGNFGTHGMIALLKQVAREQFGFNEAQFVSLVTKKFSGMIFEDPKQIRFELLDVKRDENSVVAGEANLYLEHSNGQRMIEEPIYTFKKITVVSS